MDYDIIIYVVIAVVIFARLWSVLGQRGDEDRDRPNPFAARPPDAAPRTDGGTDGVKATLTDTPLLLRPLQHAPDSLAGGLAQIKSADPAFDEKQFLQGARAAFTLILGDFAKGDLAESARLLGPAVLPRFRAAIEARQKAGQVMEHKLVAIRDAECVSVKMDGSKAAVAVRFVSEQEIALRDSGGQLVDGGKVEEITDLWTFARDTKSPDPNWILVETKS